MIVRGVINHEVNKSHVVATNVPPTAEGYQAIDDLREYYGWTGIRIFGGPKPRATQRTQPTQRTHTRTRKEH
jgi:hypothetical protein